MTVHTMPDSGGDRARDAARDGARAPVALRVVLAEDDAPARALLVEVLRAFGHDVVADVGTGAAAIEAAREMAADVVLLDVHMPDGSGIEAAEAIVRGRPATAIVLFTGDHALVLDGPAVEATGAVALLAKPVLPRQLDITLRMAASRARALAAARETAAKAVQELEHRKTVERAKGVLMRRTGASEMEAYRILQRSSQDRSQPMVEIARAVLASEPGAPASPAA